MYYIESYDGEKVVIVNDADFYRCPFLAETQAAAELIVVGLNQPILLQQLAEYRLQIETAGIDAGGVRVKTDRESQALINQAFTSLTSDLVPDVDFKAVSAWARITKAEIQSVAKAVAAHSRACFAGERVVDELVRAAATVADIDAIDIQALFSAAYQSAYDEVMQPAGV